jgi:hypothetical protein
MCSNQEEDCVSSVAVHPGRILPRHPQDRTYANVERRKSPGPSWTEDISIDEYVHWQQQSHDVPKAQVVDKAAEDEPGWIKLISSPISCDVHLVLGRRVVMQQPNQNRSRKAEERARRILPQPRIARGWISREARPFARFARSNAELDPALTEDCGLPRIFAHGRRF